MEPRIETIEPKLLIGLCSTMSLASDSTRRLWQTLMPRRREIANRASSDFLSVRVYPEIDDRMFLPETKYDKWAAVEVTDHDSMERHVLESGLYAVFVHRGPASTAAQTTRFIYAQQIPSSPYGLDHRNHFERLPEDYDPMDPDAREEVWVPIRTRP